MKPELNKRYKLSNEHLGELKGIWRVDVTDCELSGLKSDTGVNLTVHNEDWFFEEVLCAESIAKELGFDNAIYAGVVIKAMLNNGYRKG